MPMVAWYVLSNESYMNRVIKEVLPTAAIVSTVYLPDCFKSSLRTTLFAQEDKSAAHQYTGSHFRGGVPT